MSSPVPASPAPAANAAKQAPEAKPAVAKKSRRWLKLGIAACIVLLLLAYTLRNLVLGTPVDSYLVATGDLRQTVVASGRIITPQRVAVAAQLSGRVVRVAVLEGATVTRGQLLLALDDTEARAGVEQAAAALAQANAKLRALTEVELRAAQQGLRENEANWQQAEKQRLRLRDLKARGFVGQADLDTAERNAAVAKSQLESARLQVRSREPDASAAALAQAAVAQAVATEQQMQEKLKQQQILAPADGVLISRAVEPGDVVQPGQLLMALAVAGITQIEVQLDEKNLGKLALGQPALASADAYPSVRFDATVAYINPGIDATRGAVQVKLEVTAPPPYLRQDMTVSVDIKTAERKAVLVIPTGAIRDLGTTTPWVMVIRQRRAVRQTVSVGLRGDENSEILSGLKVGEAVVSASLVTVVEGAHVRARVNSAATP
jgi:HlyD family secretion protein